MMKKLMLLVMTVVISGITTTISAQFETRERRPQMTPEQIAEEKTEWLDNELSLTEKQRKKVYKLYLKEAKSMQNRHSMGGPPPGGPGGGQGRPPMGGGGRPPGGGMGHDSQPGDRGQMPQKSPNDDTLSEESEEEISKRETKMEKILTSEQYEQWVSIEKENRRKERQEKLFPKAEKESNDKITEN